MKDYTMLWIYCTWLLGFLCGIGATLIFEMIVEKERRRKKPDAN